MTGAELCDDSGELRRTIGAPNCVSASVTIDVGIGGSDLSRCARDSSVAGIRTGTSFRGMRRTCRAGVGNVDVDGTGLRGSARVSSREASWSRMAATSMI